MGNVRIGTLLCFVFVVVSTAAQAFDYKSYKEGDLDEILARPRPKTGVNVVSLQKFNFTVSLESYAKPKCPMAGILKLAMKMLPTVYPKSFFDALSMSKCIKVKSTKGTVVSLAIQDRVAEFLPEEVPLGTNIQVFCVLVAITSEGPGLVVAEFQRLPEGEETKNKVSRLRRQYDPFAVTIPLDRCGKQA